MKRLFVLHFRRMFVPLVSITAAAYVALRIAGFLTSIYTPRLTMGDELTDVMLLLLCVACAYPAGAVPFSRAMKERHLDFFHMLPVPRRRMWLAIVGGSLAALMAMQLLIVALRPALITNNGPVMAIVLATSLVLFAAGAAFSLSLASTLTVYVLGLLLLAGTAVVCSAAGALPQRIYAGAFDFASSLHGVVAAAIALAALTPVLLALSARAYERGEVMLPRSQVANMRAILLACLAGMLFALFVPALPLPGSYGEAVAMRMSPDTRKVAVLRRVMSIPFRTRVQVVDLESGDVETLRRNGIISMGWRPNNELALAWKRWHPLLSWSSHPADPAALEPVTADVNRFGATIEGRAYGGIGAALKALKPIVDRVPHSPDEEVFLAVPGRGSVKVLYAMTKGPRNGRIYRHEGNGAWTLVASDVPVEAMSPRYGPMSFQRSWSVAFDYRSGRVVYASGDHVSGYDPEDRTTIELCRCRARLVYQPHRDVVLVAIAGEQGSRAFLWRDGLVRPLPRARGEIIGVTRDAKQVVWNEETEVLSVVDLQGRAREVVLR
jgi:hypothetical protein